MSFDKDTRNLLAKTVAACRRRLTEDVTDQLRGVFGLHPDGTVLPLDKLTHLSPDQTAAARRLRDLLDHYTAGSAGKAEERRKAAYERMVLEISFTVLNRLAALRLCEERGLVVECVRRATASDGFRLFERVSGGALGGRYETYRVFIECLFDELALDLGVLFDRLTPQSAVFPTERCMEDVLAELNKPELAGFWTEDETIGWIYQYFNPPEERKAMRDASQAPRNSRELAVRNQFFTPRYVVEFLTDNTLGRIWYEMRKGDTRLKDECRYLVLRPNEVFLASGEKAPAAEENEADLSQEEILRKPVYIEDRPRKDPRDLRVLDPACGSGHFLLYAFDLLERIYEEAWEDSESPKSEATRRTLREEFETLDGLRRAAPKLIIEHNLHGIDIDARAVQIAALALWLRAQKSWKSIGLKAAERPRIHRSNIVTAEPMPGEEDMRSEFTAGLKPRVLGQLVDVMFEKMKLAGEAGSLLKIEEEIKDAVAEARKQWLESPKPEQQLLFPSMADPRPKQQELHFDVRGVTGERFWEQAEGRILDALKDYSEWAENGYAIRRRLFAEDAARGFAFIDLCRQRYDVALMNPPFGDASVPSKSYIENTYGDTKGDVYKAFIECFHARLVPAGYLGIISSRTGFFLGQSEDWRTRVVLRLFRPIALADLGSGVLDAMVEVAAYVLRSLSAPEARDVTLSLVPVLEKVVRDRQDRFSLPKWQAARDGLKRHQAVAELEHLEAHGFIQRSPGDIVRYTPLWHSVKKVTAPTAPAFPPLVCVRALAEEDKGAALIEGLRSLENRNTFVCNPRGFLEVPNATFAYWVGNKIQALFRRNALFASEGREARRGPSTGDDTRRVRCWWEIQPSDNSRERGWARLSKGGNYSPFYYDVHLVVAWDEQRFTYSGFFGRPGRMLAKLESSDCFFRPGLTWPRRSQKGLSVRPLPDGCIFADKSPTAFVAGNDSQDLLAFLAIANSSAFRGLVALQMAFGSYETGVFQRTPVPDLGGDTRTRFAVMAHRAWSTNWTLNRTETTSHAFIVPALLAVSDSTLVEHAAAWTTRVRTSGETVAAIQAEIDDLAFRLYGLDAADRAALTATLATESANSSDAEPGDDDEEEVIAAADTRYLTADLLDYALGAAFGRWDVRLALDGTLASKPPEPFDPLPVCPPGMLVGPDGLPAEPGRVVSEEWLRARPDASNLPPVGSVKTPTVPDDAYPLRVSWDGTLVDDAGFNGAQPHRDDIVRRVREVIDLLWKDKAHEIEREACDILGVSELRDYFRKPTGFFQDHLKRYSKSRRKAPIYWPLSTASGSYTVWLYYHRLTDQTLYAAVNKHVEPKITEVERRLDRIEEEAKSATGREATRLNDRLNETRTFLGELREMREELLRIAALPYRPDLNDGVIINAAPLHHLFRLRSWAKNTQDCWKKLRKGDYDWAHLAYTVWPDRVREVCRNDRSIAISHGLEDFCEATTQASNKSGGRHRRRQEAAG